LELDRACAAMRLLHSGILAVEECCTFVGRSSWHF
jgi:hypothetical protein